MQRSRCCLYHYTKKINYSSILKMSAGPFIKDGVIQHSALMTRELAGKCTLSVGPLSLPKSNNKTGGQSADPFPFDYYSSPVKCGYPDGSEDGTFLLDNVIIYNSPRTSGNNTKWPTAFNRTKFVSYFEPKLKQARDSAMFGDRRFSHTPELVWTEISIYDSGEDKTKNKTSPMEITASKVDKKTGEVRTFKFDSIAQMFERSGQAVAIRGTMACTMKLRAEITKGSELKPTDIARPIITPTQFKIMGPVNIPEPVVVGGKRSAITHEDNADDDFFAMIEQSEQNDDEEDSETEGGEAEEDEDEEAED